MKNAETKMDKTIASLQTDLAAIRAGRANASVLDKISVEYYGTMTPVAQVGSISSPDPRSLLIQPWDVSILKDIEKAILREKQIKGKTRERKNCLIIKQNPNW